MRNSLNVRSLNANLTVFSIEIFSFKPLQYISVYKELLHFHRHFIAFSLCQNRYNNRDAHGNAAQNRHQYKDQTTPDGDCCYEYRLHYNGRYRNGQVDSSVEHRVDNAQL